MKNEKLDTDLLAEGEVEPSFDKFMDDILLKESRTRRVDAAETTPQRLLIERHRERPLNRIRIGGK